MQEVRLEDVLALGEQLAALDEAGVPLSLGIRRPVRPEIERINAGITRWVGSRASLAEVVTSPEFDAPEGYRRLLVEWIAGDDLNAALESRRDLGLRKESYERRMTIGLFYPAVVAILSACGVAGMAWWVLPVFESTYAQLNEPVSLSVARLQWLRETTLVWLPFVAIAIVLGALWLRRSPSLRVTSSSRPLGPACRQRLARASEDAADLLEAGVAKPEALRIAGLPSVEGKGGFSLPPLLAWADRAGSASDLRAVGSVYEDLAKLGADRMTTYGPMLALVVVGGGALLAYALSLFVPIVELLGRLAG